MDYLTAAFPVRQMRTYVDDSGKIRSEPMSDEDGRPVICQAAVRMRDDLLEQLCALPAVGSALDHIIARFGTDAVAEVTGRSRRIVEDGGRSEEHTSELQSLMRISYAVFCLKKKNIKQQTHDEISNY